MFLREDPCPLIWLRSNGRVVAGAEVKPGDFVEIHTAYAAKVRPKDCNPETLECCEAGPFVVLAYSAKVTSGGQRGQFGFEMQSAP